MTMFSIPYQSNGKNAFFDFTLEHNSVLFAGSRHLTVNRQVCNGLITQLGKLGLTFIVGCAKGVDESFRLALADTDYINSTTVACAFDSKVKKYLGTFKLYAVSKTLPPRVALAKRTLWMTSHCSMLILFPSIPIGKPQPLFPKELGKGSALAFKSAITNKKPVFLVADKKPAESKYYQVFKSSLFGVVNGCIRWKKGATSAGFLEPPILENKNHPRWFLGTT